MRSGSPAQDGSGWPSAQRPHSDEATSSPVRYGSGPRSDPHEGPAGRREVPFGPEISWPYGFRQLDPESREMLESAYGTGPVYQQPAMDDYGYEDPRTPHGAPAFPGRSGGSRNAAAPRASGGSGHRQNDAEVPGYQVPEIRDSSLPGYAGPGYEGPGYEGPGYAGPGYQPQGFAPPSGGPEIWPVTG